MKAVLTVMASALVYPGLEVQTDTQTDILTNEGSVNWDGLRVGVPQTDSSMKAVLTVMASALVHPRLEVQTDTQTHQ